MHRLLGVIGRDLFRMIRFVEREWNRDRAPWGVYNAAQVVRTELDMAALADALRWCRSRPNPPLAALRLSRRLDVIAADRLELLRYLRVHGRDTGRKPHTPVRPARVGRRAAPNTKGETECRFETPKTA
jgi:hypothetical protein